MKVIKIGAEWCSGCIIMKPRWRNVEEEHPWLISEYFDYDNSPEAVEKYGLESGRLPTFIFLNKEDEEIDRKSGEFSEKEIIELILKYKEE